MSVRLRSALCLGLMVAVASTGVASAAAKKAAPKPVCNLVTDPADDASVDSAGAVADAALDVVSVDVASDKNNITAVVRVKKLDKSSARNWTAVFSADGTDFSVAGHITAAGTEVFDAAYAGATGGSIYGAGTTGVFDLAKNEVRITAPLSLLSAQATIKPGKTKVTGIGATTGAEFLIPDATGLFGPTLFSYSPINADTTDAGKDYLAGTPSCVTVGK